MQCILINILKIMVQYGTVQCSAVWYGMVWYGMVWYGVVWYGLVNRHKKRKTKDG